MEKKPVITIVGSGRMGSLLTKKLANNTEAFVYDKNLAKAQELSNAANAKVMDLNNFNKAEIVILALDADVINLAIKEIEGYLSAEAIIVNIATSFPHEDVIATHRVVSAKIVGHAKEIAIGEKPVIIVEGNDKEATEKVAQVFKNVGDVIIGQSNIVSQVNTIASRQGIIAGLNVQKELEGLGLPKEIEVAAIRLVTAGVMKAFAVGDAGPFVQKIIAQYEKDSL